MSSVSRPSGRRRPSTPAVLVLTSYEAVRWTIDVAPGACLQQVIVNTGEAGIGSCAVAPHGVPVELRTGADALAGCAVAWPSSTGGCDTPAWSSPPRPRPG